MPYSTSWRQWIYPSLKAFAVTCVGGIVPLFNPTAANAHALSVFVTLDCASIVVEAKYSNEKRAKKGTISLFDDNDILLKELPVSSGSATHIQLGRPLASRGFRVVVDTGSHDDYWIVTPDDLNDSCGPGEL